MNKLSYFCGAIIHGRLSTTKGGGLDARHNFGHFLCPHLSSPYGYHSEFIIPPLGVDYHGLSQRSGSRFLSPCLKGCGLRQPIAITHDSQNHATNSSFQSSRAQLKPPNRNSHRPRYRGQVLNPYHCAPLPRPLVGMELDAVQLYACAHRPRCCRPDAVCSGMYNCHCNLFAGDVMAQRHLGRHGCRPSGYRPRLPLRSPLGSRYPRPLS